MSDKEISALTDASALSGAETFHLLQGGNSREASIDQVKDYIGNIVTPGWTLVDQSGSPLSSGSTWTYSGNVASVTVTGLGNFNEILALIRGITTSSSTNRALEFSANGGSTWYTSSGDYVNVAGTGVETNAASFGYISANTASAATGSMLIRQWNATTIKQMQRDQQATSGLFTQAVALNALRLNNAGAINMTAGSLYVFGR